MFDMMSNYGALNALERVETFIGKKKKKLCQKKVQHVPVVQPDEL